MIRADIEFPLPRGRVLGRALIASGVLVPIGVVWWRTATLSADVAPPALRPEMMVLSGGTFRMGSPADEADRSVDETRHDVTLTRPFAISRTEVTQGQYRAVTGEVADCSGTDNVPADDDLPVVCVTWYEAVRYANALSELEGLEPAYVVDGDTVTREARETDGYRLPTEAEWEYAARAGTATRYVGTDSEDEVCTYANVADAAYRNAADTTHWEEGDYPWEPFACDDTYPYLSPVRGRQPNAWSLYGFGGNAAEWVWDGYVARYESLSSDDPEGDVDSEKRVVRGGSFGSGPGTPRAATRYWFEPGIREDGVSFRLSRSCSSALLPSGCLPPENP